MTPFPDNPPFAGQPGDHGHAAETPMWAAPATYPVTPPTTNQTSPGKGSTWLWQGLCLLLAVIALGAVLVTMNNGSNGRKWKSQATANGALASKLDGLLAKSEAAQKTLAARTSTLADEKAQAEDKQLLNYSFPTDVSATAGLLDQCASETRDLLVGISTAQTQSDVDRLNNEANQVFQVCSKAEGQAQSLVAYLQDKATTK